MYAEHFRGETAMRVAVVTMVLVLALAGTALAESRSREHRSERSRDNISFDFGLTLGDPHFGDSLLGSANDRGGYRVFIPRGQQGREHYNMSGGYQRSHDHYHGRNIFDQDDYLRRRYHRPGAYTVLEGPDFYFRHGNAYPYYSNPTYIFPGRSPLIIDGGGSYSMYPPSSPLPPQYRGGDGGDVYNDNRVYDNDTTNNYYGDVPAQRGEAVRPRVEPVKPKVENIGPQLEQTPEAEQPAMRSSGARFSAQVRLDTPDGVRTFKFYDGALYTIMHGEKVLLAEGVDSNFGGYALMQPTIGSAVIFRQGDSLVAAYPSADGWYTEALNLDVDFASGVQFRLMGGNAWVTLNTTDGTRYVVSLEDQQWKVVGSGSR
jgi:hypothetical protein